MTGFGKSEVSLPTKKITAEVRSLNSKQLDLNVKLPMLYRSLEYAVRSAAGAALRRGKIDLTVTVESTVPHTSAVINREIFREYVRQIDDAMNFSGIAADYDAVVPAVLRLPDVVSAEAETLSQEESDAVMRAVGEALEHLDVFRTQEGATLIADLLHRVDRIEEYKREVEPYEAARADTIRTRIRENLAQLQVDVDTNRLEQEMIFYIEKLDITEEKVRLANHCR